MITVTCGEHMQKVDTRGPMTAEAVQLLRERTEARQKAAFQAMSTKSAVHPKSEFFPTWLARNL